MNEIASRIQEELTELVADIVAQLPAFIAGIIVFFIFLAIGRRMKKFVEKAVHLRTEDLTTAVIFGRIASTLVLVIGILVGAGIAFPGLSFDSLVATLGLSSIAIGFAFKDIFENFIAGLMILLQRPFSIGDVLRTQGVTGKVEEIGVRSVTIRQFDGELVVVPAVKMVSDVVTVVANQNSRRFQITVGISYDSDVDQAVQIVKQALADLDFVLEAPEPAVVANVFNASSVDLDVYYWIDTTQSSVFDARSKVVNQLKRVLEANNIEIPFPMQTTIIKERSS